jgi:hydroxymethylbilane synthase
MRKVLKIGTRPSDLAIRQVQQVISKLHVQFPDISFVIVPMKTTGDIRRDRMDLNVRDKKEWVIELEHQIVSGGVDFAIHSAKDVPLQLENNTSLMTVLPRCEYSDVLLYNNSGENPCPGTPLPMLYPGANVGTSSKRRKSQLLRLRPDLCVTLCRGNVPTRISKMREQKLYDGIILAGAGLERLSLHGHPLSYVFGLDEMLPAVGQGTLIAQYESGRSDIESMLDTVKDKKTQIEYEAERAFVDVLGADCHSSVGVYARLFDNILNITGRVLSEDGFDCVEGRLEGDISNPSRTGRELGSALLSQGASSLL